MPDDSLSLILWKSFRIPSFLGPYNPAFGLYTESSSGNLPIQSECWPEKLHLRTLFTQCKGINENGQSLNWFYKKTKARQIFRKTNIFLHHDTRTSVCVSEYKKRSFSGKFGLLCFFITLVLRLALLPHYRRFVSLVVIHKFSSLLMIIGI